VTNINEIFSYAQKIGGAPGRDITERAYHLAENIHSDHKRASGVLYIDHCIAVTKILCDLNLDISTIAAGFLHDVLEETFPNSSKPKITFEELKVMVGDEIANLVNGVTKLDVTLDMAYRPYEDEAESFRKMFLAMADDLRIVLIKLADRLHNMQTVSALSPERQQRLAKETLEIWAPLANRLGIWQIKNRLEDLSFRVTHPDLYREISSQIVERQSDKPQNELNTIINYLKKELKDKQIQADIFGRPKHIYSIYLKMLRKKQPIEKIYDIRAIRVIVSDIATCYSTLGIIHATWRPIPGEFDDYIASSKSNGYKSLHTAVLYNDGKPLEVQIRTKEMDSEAEYGIAAHWIYKEGNLAKRESNKINKLRMMIDWRQDTEDAHSFLEAMKTDVFQDRIYIFTPRGDIIDLPAGSTPIDFAYTVHTDIGHRCRGARVNGKLVPLDHELKTGDQVEILTAKRGGPSRDWLNNSLGLVKTARAKSKIRIWFKKLEDEQNLANGRNTLERELQRLGITEVNFEKLARGLGFKTPEEMYIDLGTGELSISKLIKQFSEDEEIMDILEANAPAHVQKPTDAIEVLGLKGMLASMAKCCNPMPGDQIVGYITRGRGATIHRQDCPNILLTPDRERLLKVSWGHAEQTFPVPVKIKAYDRQGLMSDISILLSDENININDVSVNVNRSIADLKLVIEVKDLTQLSRILTRIENLPNVMEAVRTKPG
jgi:GTP pyrophosphokinase